MNPIAQRDRVHAGWRRDDGTHAPKNARSRTSRLARPCSGADPKLHPETA